MSLIERIRTVIWQRQTLQLLERRPGGRGIPLSEAKTALIYGAYESSEQFHTFCAFADQLAHQGLKVYRVIYSPVSPAKGEPEAVVSDPAQRLFVIRPQDLVFRRYPEGAYCRRLADVTEDVFDLVLDTSEQSHFVDVYMTALLPARLKIGFVKDIPLKQSPYDLTVRPSENQNLGGRLNLLLHYLDVFVKPGVEASDSMAAGSGKPLGETNF